MGKKGSKNGRKILKNEFKLVTKNGKKMIKKMIKKQ